MDTCGTEQQRPPGGPELSAGHAIKAALHAGLRVEALPVDEEPYLDIGTPEDLAKAVRPSPGWEPSPDICRWTSTD